MRGLYSVDFTVPGKVEIEWHMGPTHAWEKDPTPMCLDTRRIIALAPDELGAWMQVKKIATARGWWKEPVSG